MEIFAALTGCRSGYEGNTGRFPMLSIPSSGSITDEDHRTGVRVLLAEDNQVNQMAAKAMLDSLGCRTDMVNNGKEAMEAAKKQGYDIILMDCQMPLMDGLTATELILASNETLQGKVPIVALTAHVMESDRDRCLAAGMDTYASRPFSLDDLRRVIEGNATSFT